MHSDKKGSNQKGGSLMTQKTNEDFNKKRPRIGDPDLKQSLPTKELPLIAAPGKKIDTEIRMIKPPAGNESDLNQTNNFADSETPIDNSDSITGKTKEAGK